MPIIIITGLPSSGKSTIASRIHDEMKQRYPEATTCIIKDEDCSNTPVRQHYGVVSMVGSLHISFYNGNNLGKTMESKTKKNHQPIVAKKCHNFRQFELHQRLSL